MKWTLKIIFKIILFLIIISNEESLKYYKLLILYTITYSHVELILRK